MKIQLPAPGSPPAKKPPAPPAAPEAEDVVTPDGLHDYRAPAPPVPGLVRFGTTAGKVVGASAHGLFKGASYGILGGGVGFLAGAGLGLAADALGAHGLVQSLRVGASALGGAAGLALGLYDGIPKGWEAGGKQGRSLAYKLSGEAPPGD